MRPALLLSITFGLMLTLYACKKLEPGLPKDNATLDGPVDGLSPEQYSQFLRGDNAFNAETFTSDNGLGPLFVAASCGSCHAGDGKGHPFTTLTRFGQKDSSGNTFLHLGAPQLQNRALPGHQPESLPVGATFSKFTPPANSGLGFLDAIADATILALADPDDKDGDGISGVAQWVPLKPYLSPRAGSIVNKGFHIGRFGKKGSAYDLLQQTAGAYNQDMGITSTYEPYDTWSGHEIDPEITNQKLLDVVFYLKTLKAPVLRNQSDANVTAGKAIFTNIGCDKCHTPSLKTGSSPIAALSYKTINPYTDLLLHDMGAALDDGYTEGMATSAEWRTPPLWGLGLSKASQGGQYYLLHDGRAHSIEAAIELHGGEGTKSKNQYQNLTAQEKAQLVQFLESL